MKFYKVPAALQWHEWDEFWDDTKAKYPIQYFFRHTLPVWVSRHITHPADRLKWKILHTIHPRYRYHIIKPRSLERGYHDPDHQIRAAAFDTLSVYAERKLMGDGVSGLKWTQEDLDYYNNEGSWDKESFQIQFEREKKIVELRNWWVIDRKHREMVETTFVYYEEKPEWGESWILNPKYRDTPEYERYKKNSEYIRQIEDQWKEEDQRKFHELVDLLPYLWY